MAKEKKYSNSESFEIYCNYGVLGAEKRNVYTYGCEHCHAVCSDEMKVYLPANDVFHIYKNHEGLLMVETEWGFCYEINEILEGNETPCFYALDRDKKGHREYIKIVEEQ